MTDIYVYTDGGCINNGKKNAKAGIGIYFGNDDPRNVSKRIEGKQTNNTAELKAILEALKILKKEIKEKINIYIITDSEYAIKCCTSYGSKLYKSNWKIKGDKIIPNLELIKELFDIISNNPNIHFQHIMAHTNKEDIHSIGNYNADLLATSSITNNNYDILTKLLITDNIDSLLLNVPHVNNIKKIYLNVPYTNKEEAKSLGERWDKNSKKWYF
jgi:ribonuclease HI